MQKIKWWLVALFVAFGVQLQAQDQSLAIFSKSSQQVQEMSEIARLPVRDQAAPHAYENRESARLDGSVPTGTQTTANYPYPGSDQPFVFRNATFLPTNTVPPSQGRMVRQTSFQQPTLATSQNQAASTSTSRPTVATGRQMVVGTSSTLASQNQLGSNGQSNTDPRTTSFRAPQGQNLMQPQKNLAGQSSTLALGRPQYRTAQNSIAANQNSAYRTNYAAAQNRTAQNCNCAPTTASPRGTYATPAQVYGTQRQTAYQTPSLNNLPELNIQLPGQAGAAMQTAPQPIYQPQQLSTNIGTPQFGAQGARWWTPFVSGSGAYSPLIKLQNLPPGTYLGQGVVGQPTAYVDGQPLRNLLRYVFP